MENSYALQVQTRLWKIVMVYRFKLGHNDMETTKNICCATGEDVVNHISVIRLLKKFYVGCKNLDDHTKSCRSKTIDFKDVFQAGEVNLVSST